MTFSSLLYHLKPYEQLGPLSVPYFIFLHMHMDCTWKEAGKTSYTVADCHHECSGSHTLGRVATMATAMQNPPIRAETTVHALQRRIRHQFQLVKQYSLPAENWSNVSGTAPPPFSCGDQMCLIVGPVVWTQCIIKSFISTAMIKQNTSPILSYLHLLVVKNPLG